MKQICVILKLFIVLLALISGLSYDMLTYAQAGTELGVLGLNASSAGEANVQVAATITRSGDVTDGLIVRLTSSDVTELLVPTTVEIPAGGESADIVLNVVNDGDIDGVQSVTIVASAVGYSDATQEIEIGDDDTSTRRTLGGHLFGTIASDVYVVLSSIVVDEGQTLDIEPGAILGFGPGVGVTAYGSLVAVGEPGREILFTSQGLENREDMGDWQAPFEIAPADAYWPGITNSGGQQQDSRLSQMVIQFADTALTIDGVQPGIIVSNSSISQNSADGIVIHEAWSDRVQILDNTIHHNGGNGIWARAYSAGCNNDSVSPQIIGNEIYRNSRGIYLEARSSSTSRCYNHRRGATMGGNVQANYIHHNESGIVGDSARVRRTWRLSGERNGNYTDLHTLIRNNIVVDNLAVGISFTTIGSGKPSISSNVANNTVVGNGGAGIWHSPDVDRGFTIQNNIVSGNGSGIAAGSPGDANEVGDWLVSYNNVVDNNDNDWVNYPAVYGTPDANSVDGIPTDIAMNVSVDPYFVRIGYWDLRGTPDALDDDIWIPGDYHLRSSAGRWDPVAMNWVTDDIDSPCIDAGDPEMPADNETAPNGECINMGAYGGTWEASLSL